jgi:O-acetyl-ADP-ribose deacetylase (regulator of RNase III)
VITRIDIGYAELTLTQDDITVADVDAVVNAANPGLMGGGGVDGAIHRAGGPVILEETSRWVAANGRLGTGRAMMTTAGDMSARHVIHTVGPVWAGGIRHEADLLERAYRACLTLAAEHDLASVALPSISTGAYGYPIHQAAPVALRTVADVLSEPSSLREVRFVLFDERALAAYADALGELAVGAE